MALYRAKRDGLVGAAYIHAGEVFSADFGRDPSWADRVEDPFAGDQPADGTEQEKAVTPTPKSKKAKGK